MTFLPLAIQPLLDTTNGQPSRRSRVAEKAVKALFQFLHGSVRGHGVTEMLRQLPAPIAAPESLLDAARELDKVYVTARYPNGFASGAPADYFTDQTSRQLIDHARTILDFCRSQIH